MYCIVHSLMFIWPCVIRSVYGLCRYLLALGVCMLKGSSLIVDKGLQVKVSGTATPTYSSKGHNRPVSLLLDEPFDLA